MKAVCTQRLGGVDAAALAKCGCWALYPPRQHPPYTPANLLAASFPFPCSGSFSYLRRFLYHWGPAMQMMQDWLSERGLDRKALDALTRNALQYQAYVEYQAGQGGL